jgi:hypothetical protein
MKFISNIKIEIEDLGKVSSTNEVLSDQLVQSGITLKLVDNELWQKFHSNGTEMIITKAGR